MRRCEVYKMLRWKDDMCRSEGVKIICADVNLRRCEDEKMICVDTKYIKKRRYEDEKMMCAARRYKDVTT